MVQSRPACLILEPAWAPKRCKLLSGKAVLLSINILAHFQAEAPIYPSRCWRHYSTAEKKFRCLASSVPVKKHFATFCLFPSLLQKFPSFSCNLRKNCLDWRLSSFFSQFCHPRRRFWAKIENMISPNYVLCYIPRALETLDKKWKFCNCRARRRRPLWCQWRPLCGFGNFGKKILSLGIFFQYFENLKIFKILN